ncbi:ABC transporter ATP-binding protein, partial [bacterium]|nr:ABC transporter ATP-binding protein [candidate division CSSED10-310 bacterium]
MGEHIVQACQLTKNFKTLTAVDHIDFSIRQGECFGFLGPNGAGKTTTVRMIYCFTPLSSGSLTVFGMDVNRHARAIKSLVGICPQETNLDPDFSVEKNLWVFGRYFGFKKSHLKDKIESLLSFTELTGKRKEK